MPDILSTLAVDPRGQRSCRFRSSRATRRCSTTSAKCWSKQPSRRTIRRCRPSPPSPPIPLWPPPPPSPFADPSRPWARRTILRRRFVIQTLRRRRARTRRIHLASERDRRRPAPRRTPRATTSPNSAQNSILRSGLLDRRRLGQSQWILADQDGVPIKTIHFGMPGATPVTGDWDGSGTTKVGVFLDGLWFLDLNGNGVWDEGDLWVKLGKKGDQPVSRRLERRRQDRHRHLRPGLDRRPQGGGGRAGPARCAEPAGQEPPEKRAARPGRRRRRLADAEEGQRRQDAIRPDRPRVPVRREGRHRRGRRLERRRHLHHRHLPQRRRGSSTWTATAAGARAT